MCEVALIKLVSQGVEFVSHLACQLFGNLTLYLTFPLSNGCSRQWPNFDFFLSSFLYKDMVTIMVQNDEKLTFLLNKKKKT